MSQVISMAIGIVIGAVLAIAFCLACFKDWIRAHEGHMRKMIAKSQGQWAGKE